MHTYDAMGKHCHHAYDVHTLIGKHCHHAFSIMCQLKNNLDVVVILAAKSRQSKQELNALTYSSLTYGHKNAWLRSV